MYICKPNTKSPAKYKAEYDLYSDVDIDVCVAWTLYHLAESDYNREAGGMFIGRGGG